MSYNILALLPKSRSIPHIYVVTSLICFCQCSSALSPVCSELQPFSVSSAPLAAAGADAVGTGSGPAATSAALTAPSGEQVASHVQAAAAVGPKHFWVEKGIERSTRRPKKRERGQEKHGEM